MRETIMPLLEGEIINNMNINEDYHSVDTITENQKRLLGFTTEKVIILKEQGGPYLLEFAGNLERYMAENDMTFERAMDSIQELYTINRGSINVVLNESDIGKLDIKTLEMKGYNFLRYDD